MDRKLVVKSNKLIEAGFMLSLSEQRLILLAITRVRRDRPLHANDVFTVSAEDFISIFGINHKNAYRDLETASKQLFSRYITIDTPDPDFPKLKFTTTRWISSIGYIPEEGRVVLMFAQKIIPYLSMLESQFTRYKLESIANMTSSYAIRFYELLMQWNRVGRREVSLEWLKQQFQIEDKYKAIKDLKKHVIDPAVSQINEHSDLQVSYDQRKAGRVVTHLIFTFGPKPKLASPEKRSKKGTELVNGVSKADIEQHARIGESWEQAAERLKKQGLVG
jgi:plasmid replication initiation protein